MDADGNSIVGLPDIGAYEYVGSSSGGGGTTPPADTTPPAPPALIDVK